MMLKNSTHEFNNMIIEKCCDVEFANAVRRKWSIFSVLGERTTQVQILKKQTYSDKVV